MVALFIILIIVACLLLMLVVLVQNPKGGGLSSAFGGQGNQMLGGVKRSGDFLDKATWGLATLLLVLILLSNTAIPAFANRSGDATADDPSISVPATTNDLSTPADPANGTPTG